MGDWNFEHSALSSAKLGVQSWKQPRVRGLKVTYVDSPRRRD
jgi:hypothetical protein